jgi:glycosyltransferase involved in cell wall biosynthesis
MEQIIAPRRSQHRILQAEHAAAEAWSSLEPDGNVDEIARREEAAWAIADRIVCGSEFVRQEIGRQGGPVVRCTVVPYGVSTAAFSAARKDDGRRDDRPLRVLFVGGIGLRKGVRHLLAAMRMLDPEKVQCRLVGSGSLPEEVLRTRVPPNVELVGRVPRSRMPEVFGWADVFCLPSLCEGSATAIYEALAAGLPVVTTPNAGSIVRDGVEGFVVPICDAESIAARLEELCADEQLRQRMARAAQERSAYGSLEAYGKRLMETLCSPDNDSGSIGQA